MIQNCKYLTLNSEGRPKLRKRHTYYAQVQLGMAILNLSQCDFIVYNSFEDRCVVVKVDVDLDFVHELLSKLSSIFFRKMLHTLCKK